MHPKYTDTLLQITAWAQANSALHGVIVIGSQARAELPADQWSDLDLMLLVEDPAALATDDAWFECFGEVVCCFDEVVPLHFTDWQWRVRRVLYADGRDVDFSVLPHNRLEEVLQVNRDILSRGWRVVYDACPGLLEAKLRPLPQAADIPAARPPTEQDLRAVVSELLFHVIWAGKKIRRGELWVAMSCINSYMKDLLLRLIEMHNASYRRPDALQYNGRFLEQRTAPEILDRLAGCFTRYDADEAVQTLGRLIDFIQATDRAIREQNGYEVNAAPFEKIRIMYAEMHTDKPFDE